MVFKLVKIFKLIKKDTYFTQLFSENFTIDNDKNKEIFIDRDGKVFRYILNFLRNPREFLFPLNETNKLIKLNDNKNIFKTDYHEIIYNYDLALLNQEAEFYGLEVLNFLIETNQIYDNKSRNFYCDPM
jgi:hypothetical protein